MAIHKRSSQRGRQGNNNTISRVQEILAGNADGLHSSIVPIVPPIARVSCASSNNLKRVIFSILVRWGSSSKSTLGRADGHHRHGVAVRSELRGGLGELRHERVAVRASRGKRAVESLAGAGERQMEGHLRTN